MDRCRFQERVFQATLCHPVSTFSFQTNNNGHRYASRSFFLPCKYFRSQAPSLTSSNMNCLHVIPASLLLVGSWTRREACLSVLADATIHSYRLLCTHTFASFFHRILPVVLTNIDVELSRYKTQMKTTINIYCNIIYVSKYMI